jgi:dimeric dUTPase (all-alpha-NTP-PPase superfamily)
MNLEEAIEHARQVQVCSSSQQCTDEHRQLAEWLEELHSRRAAQSTIPLERLWSQQEKFMQLLQEKRNFHKYPVDLTSKSGQKAVKDIAHDCMHEIFEAVHLLKNSKEHRATQVNGFAREDFKEELSDALHYFFEICILSGITMEEFCKSYLEKGQVNTDRIMNGY